MSAFEFILEQACWAVGPVRCWGESTKYLNYSSRWGFIYPNRQASAPCNGTIANWRQGSSSNMLILWRALRGLRACTVKFQRTGIPGHGHGDAAKPAEFS
jgi:hypothetical protein